MVLGCVVTVAGTVTGGLISSGFGLVVRFVGCWVTIVAGVPETGPDGVRGVTVAGPVAAVIGTGPAPRIPEY